MFSALPPKADSNRTSRHVRKVPILLQKSAYRRRGTADAFFEAIHCHPLLCGRLTLDFTDACNAYAAHKGANGGGRATNLASLRRFCAISTSDLTDVTYATGAPVSGELTISKHT